MKTTVTVTTLQPFEWKGKQYLPDQSISLTPIDAIVLSRKRQVTLSKRKAKPAPVAPPPVAEPEPEPPKRRTYKRKDIQAEEIAPPVEVTHTDPIVESSEPESEF